MEVDTKNLSESLESDLQYAITQKVAEAMNQIDISTVVEGIVNQRLNDRLAQSNIDSIAVTHLEQTITKVKSELDKKITESATKQVTTEVTRQVSLMDFNSVVNSIVGNKVESMVKVGHFGKESIDHTSINFKGFKLPGDHIDGGIIKNFGSTGIDDKSTDIQMTILDTAVAFEKGLWAPSASIKGDLTVEGNLTLNGSVNEDSPMIKTLSTLAVNEIKSDTELLDAHSEHIYKKISRDGLDLLKIKQEGRVIITGNQLGYHITDSNLQRVGQLKDLQTQGETLLSDTLYTSGKRVGVNTLDPSTTFVVWDEEVEMIMTKKTNNTGYIGTARQHTLILGSHNKENIILDPDGSVQIEELRIGNVPMTSASVIPNYNSITGTIVWNESPSPGSPMGWVCLGGTAWAKFGKVE